MVSSSLHAGDMVATVSPSLSCNRCNRCASCRDGIAPNWLDLTAPMWFSIFGVASLLLHYVQGLKLESKLARQALWHENPFTAKRFDAETVFTKDLETDRRTIRLMQKGLKYEEMELSDVEFAYVKTPDLNAYDAYTAEIYIQEKELVSQINYRRTFGLWHLKATKGGGYVLHAFVRKTLTA